MKFLDALLGRSPEVKADLDALFALPPAAITLEAAAGLACSGQAAVCYKPAGGQYFAATQEELEGILSFDAGERAATVREEADSYGYRWVVIEHPLVEDLVNRVHMANATLEGRGFGPQLLCSVFGLANAGQGEGTAGGVEGSGSPAGSGSPTAAPGGGSSGGSGGSGGGTLGSATLGPGRRAYLVYLYKRGTFYPFCPAGGEQRDNELELRLRGVLEGELAVEADLARWFPLWGLPLG